MTWSKEQPLSSASSSTSNGKATLLARPAASNPDVRPLPKLRLTPDKAGRTIELINHLPFNFPTLALLIFLSIVVVWQANVVTPHA
ncbi:MAG: hypothetical protein AAF614_17600 [Chloroflexota bacterium]